MPRGDPSIVSFEMALAKLAVAVTPEIRRAVEAAAVGLSERNVGGRRRSQSGEATGEAVGLASWSPSCLVPSSLYDFYRGWDVSVSREAALDGFRDLEMLRIPGGLSEGTFNEWMRSVLLQHPRLSALVGKAREKAVDAESAGEYFTDELAPHVESPVEAFRISAMWIAYFFAESLELRQEAGREVLGTPRS